MNDETIFDAEVPPPEEAYQLSPANVFPWPPTQGESPILAWVETWKGASLHPSAFFAAMPEEASLGPSLLYFIILGLVVAGVGLFWALILPRPVLDSTSTPSAFEMMRSIGPLVAFLISPVIQIVGLFFGAAITQLMLMMLVPTRGSYRRTARVYCYSHSPALLAVIPFIGPLIGMIWSIVVSIIGLREAHRTTTGRAATAVLLPSVLLFLLFVVIVVIVVAGALMIAK